METGAVGVRAKSVRQLAQRPLTFGRNSKCARSGTEVRRRCGSSLGPAHAQSAVVCRVADVRFRARLSHGRWNATHSDRLRRLLGRLSSSTLYRPAGINAPAIEVLGNGGGDVPAWTRLLALSSFSLYGGEECRHVVDIEQHPFSRCALERFRGARRKIILEFYGAVAVEHFSWGSAHHVKPD